MSKTAMKRVKLFKGAALEEGKSKRMAELSSAMRSSLTTKMSDLENKAASYDADVKKPLTQAKQELDSLKQMVDSNPTEAVKKLSTLLGISSPEPPAPPKPEAPAAPAIPGAEKVTGPPSPSAQKEVKEMGGDVKNQMGELSNILEQAPQGAPGGGEQMSTSQLSLRDVIKLAISKSAQDPPLPSPTPAAPPAPPTPGAPPAPDAQATAMDTLKIHSIPTILGDPSSSKDDKSLVGITRDSLNLIDTLVKEELDNGLVKGKEAPVIRIRDAADNITEGSLTINQALDNAVESLRNLCQAVESNNISSDAKSLATALGGLKDYLNNNWPKTEDIETQSVPENSEE